MKSDEGDLGDPLIDPRPRDPQPHEDGGAHGGTEGVGVGEPHHALLELEMTRCCGSVQL